MGNITVDINVYLLMIDTIMHHVGVGNICNKTENGKTKDT